MKVVDEYTVLEVGKFYNVRCAGIKSGLDGNIFTYVPVIGIIHNDKKAFNFDITHIHVDGRFNNNHIPLVNGRTNSIVQYGYNPKYPYHSYFTEYFIKRKKCMRLTTGINPPTHAKNYNDWYKSMIGKSCAGKKCPHLGTIMIEQDGVLVCPLHNLKGCPQKEVIIKNAY